MKNGSAVFLAVALLVLLGTAAAGTPEVAGIALPNEDDVLVQMLLDDQIPIEERTELINETLMHIYPETLPAEERSRGLMRLVKRDDAPLELRYLAAATMEMADIVTVNARIDGIVIGSMKVAVASVSHAPDVCYLRTLSASANNVVTVDFEKPLSLFPGIGGYVPESSQLNISSSISNTRMRFSLPTTRDSYIETSLMIRLRHHRGPALSHTKLRVIMVSIDGRSYSPVLEHYADGTRLYGNCISMVEKFPALSMKVTLTNAGAIFADTGTTVKIVKADEFDQNGQANLYILSKPTGTSAGYGIIAEMLVDEN